MANVAGQSRKLCASSAMFLVVILLLAFSQTVLGFSAEYRSTLSSIVPFSQNYSQLRCGPFCQLFADQQRHKLKIRTTTKISMAEGDDSETVDDRVSWSDKQLELLESQEIEASSRQVKKQVRKLPFVTGLRYLLALSKGRHPQYTKELVDKYGKESFMIWNKYITLTNADEISDVLERYNLEKPTNVKEAFKVIFFPKGGILAADWEDWKTQRRMTAPSLSEAVIGELTPKFEEASQPFFEIIENAAATGKIIEMDEVFVALTMDTIGLILLGQTFGLLDRIRKGETEPVPFLEALTLMGFEATRQSALPRWVLKYKLWRPSRKVREAKNIINDFLESCIEDRLNDNARGKESDINLLNILLKAEAKGEMSRTAVKEQLLTFVFAGYDTTAHTMCFMLYEASKNPHILQKVEEESLLAMPERNSPVLDVNEINSKAKFLEQVWMETLRLHPAAAAGTQRVTGDDPIVVGDGLELPPGKNINMSPFVIHRDERYWPDPETFDPSRFEPDAIAQQVPCSLFSFSAGPRNCLGSRLARAEALTYMTSLFRRFHVSCVEKEEVEEVTLFTTKPKGGIRFLFRPRP